MKVPSAGRVGKFVRKQKSAAVEGTKRAAHTAAEVSGRGLDAAVAGSKRGLAGLSDLSARAGSATVQTSKAGATAIAGATTTGAAVAASGARTAASGVVDVTAKGAATAMSGGQYAARGIVDASSRGLSVASEGGRQAMEFGRKSAADLLSVSQGVLASGLAVDLNAMLARVSAGAATIYDRAMDAEYIATSIGGGNHRMFDGGHTLAGAFEAVRGASAEDTLLQEGFGYMQGPLPGPDNADGAPAGELGQGDLRPGVRVPAVAVPHPEGLVLRHQQLRRRPKCSVQAWAWWRCSSAGTVQSRSSSGGSQGAWASRRRSARTRCS